MTEQLLSRIETADVEVCKRTKQESSHACDDAFKLELAMLVS